MFAQPTAQQTSEMSLLRKSVRAVVGVTALLSIATGTVACNSDDAAVIGGTIAIVAGAVAIGSALDNDHDHRDRDRRDRDRDRWERDHRPGRPGYGPGYGPGRPGRPGRYASGFELKADSPLALASVDTTVNEIASKYSLPLESAERFTTILQEAAAGEKSAFASIGLSNDELTRVARYEMPSQTALDKIATSLAMSRGMAQGLVQQLMNETRTQMADISSPAWTACQSTGKWKTDANGGTCKSTSWAGCSPATGASMCASVQ